MGWRWRSFKKGVQQGYYNAMHGLPKSWEPPQLTRPEQQQKLEDQQQEPPPEPPPLMLPPPK